MWFLRGTNLEKLFVFNWPCPIFAAVVMGESGQNPEQFPLLYMQKTDMFCQCTSQNACCG